jgi:hypothetical protein
MAVAREERLVAPSKRGEPCGITDGDVRPIAGDHSTFLELGEGARDQLANRPEASSELGLRQGEIDRRPRFDGLAHIRIQVARQPPAHRPEGQVTDDAREMTDAARQRLEHGECDRWTSLTQTKYLDARQEQDPGRHEGDRRSDVSTSIEQRSLAERGTRTFRVEYLLAAAQGDLPDLHTAVGNDQKPATGFTLFEERLSNAEAPHGAAPGQEP